MLNEPWQQDARNLFLSNAARRRRDARRLTLVVIVAFVAVMSASFLVGLYFGHTQ